jgi:hypothetical protein
LPHRRAVPAQQAKIPAVSAGTPSSMDSSLWRRSTSCRASHDKGETVTTNETTNGPTSGRKIDELLAEYEAEAGEITKQEMHAMAKEMGLPQSFVCWIRRTRCDFGSGPFQFL